MNSDQLKVIRTIAEEGSLTAAAEKLYISQPALSKTVRKLEDELGCELFTRSAKGVSPTSDCKVLLRYAGKVLDSLQEAEEYFQNKVNTTAVVRGAAPTESYFRIFLSKYILEKTAKINMSIVEDELAYSLLANCNADFAIASDVSFSKAKNVKSLLLFKEQLFLSVPLSHPLSESSSVSLSELSGTHMIRSVSRGFESWVDALLKQASSEAIFESVLDTYTLEVVKLDSPLPYFTKSSTYLLENIVDHRIKRKIVPISDKAASKYIYFWYLRDKTDFVKPLLNHIYSSVYGVNELKL
jgi:DNA-binding transcriptional LysR family regulator